MVCLINICTSDVSDIQLGRPDYLIYPWSLNPFSFQNFSMRRRLSTESKTVFSQGMNESGFIPITSSILFQSNGRVLDDHSGAIRASARRSLSSGRSRAMVSIATLYEHSRGHTIATLFRPTLDERGDSRARTCALAVSRTSIAPGAIGKAAVSGRRKEYIVEFVESALRSGSGRRCSKPGAKGP